MLKKLAKQLYLIAKQQKIVISVAESCTGGMVGSTIVSIPGSSDVFDCGFITYSYQSKTKILDVDQDLILQKGAVSFDVAKAMSIGAIKKSSNATLSVAITGIAGPTGATASKPIGLVYIATNFKNDIHVKEYKFLGTRNQIRKNASQQALQDLINRISI
jgi:PncC family amidohydrolase